MSYSYYLVGAVAAGTVGLIGYKFVKTKLQEYVMRKVMEELDKRMDDEEGFTPLKRSTSAMLKIKHGGKSHSIYIPYDRKNARKMLQSKVFLLKGEEKIDITQKPGVPYLVSADQLGGEMIVVENKEGEVLYVFKEDQIPNCF